MLFATQKEMKRDYSSILSKKDTRETVYPNNFLDDLIDSEDYPRNFSIWDLAEEPLLVGSAQEDLLDFVSEQPKELRISNLIKKLEKLKEEEGDLVLCTADKNSLLTLSTDNLNFEVKNKKSYGLSVGLSEENYLSVKIE